MPTDLKQRIQEMRRRQVLRGNANDRWYVEDVDILIGEIERQAAELARYHKEDTDLRAAVQDVASEKLA